MKKVHLQKAEVAGFRLPLSSLRLLVPPFHLMSALMWQVLQHKNIMHFGKLEEFVSAVTETVPQLLTYRQRAQLLLGLRARMVLEVLQGPADAKVIQAHLDNMLLPAIPAGFSVNIDSDLEVAVSHFKALVLALLKDPAEKAYFFQAVFPVEYGPRFHTALKELMWELLSGLERLLPVPDFKKTVSLLTPAPSGLDECMQSETESLRALLQQRDLLCGADGHHGSRVFTFGNISPTSGDCILSSLSIPPSTHAAVSTEPTVFHIQPTTVTILNHSALTQLGADAIVVTDYSEVELSSQDVAEDAQVIRVRVNTGGSSGVEVHSAEDAVDVEEITINEHVGLLKNPEDEKPPSETSTQYEVTDGGDGGVAVTENSSADMEEPDGVKKEVMDQEKGVATPGHPPGDGLKKVMNSSSANESQAAPLRRGRPRKSSGTTKVVYKRRRKGRPPSHVNHTANEEDFDSNTEKEPRTPESAANSVESCDAALTTPHRGAPENPRARYVCSTCGRKFTRTSDVRRHQLTHTGERPFHCSQCEKTFQHAWDLTKHCRKFHGNATFSCSLCSSQFVNLRALTAHHKESHGSKVPHYCSICGLASPSATALIQHRKLHSVTQQYWCEQCGEGFDTLLQRSLHRQSHRIRPKFTCPQCDKTYSRRSDVKRHMLSHTGERPHKCNHCGKTFMLRSGLQKHQLVHTGEKPFPCPHCPKAFSLLSVWRRHERMHTGERPYLCSQCGKRFLSLGELLKHDKSHTDARPHSCGQCQKSFKSKRALQVHAVSHTGMRPYSCSYCGKRFSKVFALNRHHLIHTGERPFACSHCDKTFLTATEQALHERVHTGERPYSCSECQWTFRSSSELGRHKRTHGGQLAYSCSHCPKTYTTTAKLKKHMRLHMGEAHSRFPVEISHTVEVPASTMA